CSRKSRCRRHVARIVHDTGALGWIRVDPTPNAQRPTLNAQLKKAKSNLKPQTSNIDLVADVLHLARDRFPCQRPNRVDAAADRNCGNQLRARLAASPTL